MGFQLLALLLSKGSTLSNRIFLRLCCLFPFFLSYCLSFFLPYTYSLFLLLFTLLALQGRSRVRSVSRKRCARGLYD